MLEKIRKIWAYISQDGLVLLILGFFLTTVIGSMINSSFQSQSWKRQKQFEILRSRFEGGLSLVEHLATLIGDRFFGLQRVFWALESYSDEEFEKIWGEYYETVILWNKELIANRAKIRIFIGDEEALGFLDYQDEIDSYQPKSLHGNFKLLHDLLLNLKRCISSSCKDKGELWKKSRSTLRQIDIYSDNYVERIADVVFEKSANMKLNQ